MTNPDTNTGGRASSIYLFVRAESFYPIELRDDEDAKANALCNPGTLRVEDVNGCIVWERTVIQEREK